MILTGKQLSDGDQTAPVDRVPELREEVES